MTHYTSEQWINFKSGQINPQSCLSMENHLLECDQCMKFYLELIDGNDLEQAEKHIPSGFATAMMQHIKSTRPIIGLEKSKSLAHIKKIRRKIISFYAAAAVITIALTGAGFFDLLLEKSSTLKPPDLSPYLEETQSANHSQGRSIFSQYFNFTNGKE